VETLAPDANDSDDDESYDTNPTPSDPDWLILKNTRAVWFLDLNPLIES
jgi:hypothetical protein